VRNEEKQEETEEMGKNGWGGREGNGREKQWGGWERENEVGGRGRNCLGFKNSVATISIILVGNNIIAVVNAITIVVISATNRITVVVVVAITAVTAIAVVFFITILIILVVGITVIVVVDIIAATIANTVGVVVVAITVITAISAVIIVAICITLVVAITTAILLFLAEVIPTAPIYFTEIARTVLPFSY
jgi:hypothetical protein